MLPLLLAAANLAPIIAKYFTAPDSTVSTIAQDVSSIATTITGAKTPEEAIKQIAASDDLKQKFQLAVIDKQMSWDAMYLQDMANARDRDVKLAQAGQQNHRANFLVGVAIVVVIVLTVLVVWHSNLNEYVKGIITLVLGRFLGYVDQIYNFEFGTTRSSRQKDDTITTLSKGAN